MNNSSGQNMLTFWLALTAVIGVAVWYIYIRPNPRNYDVGHELDHDVVIIIEDLQFTPTEVELESGRSYEFLVESRDANYSFVIDEFDVHTGLLEMGQEEEFTLEIPEDASGEYLYYSDLSSQRAVGLEGKIIISD